MACRMAQSIGIAPRPLMSERREVMLCDRPMCVGEIDFVCEEVGERAVYDVPCFSGLVLFAPEEPLPLQQSAFADFSRLATCQRSQPFGGDRLLGHGEALEHRTVQRGPLRPSFVLNPLHV